jgi:hypothetical protein
MLLCSTMEDPNVPSYTNAFEIWKRILADHEATVLIEVDLLDRTKREDLPLLISRPWFTTEAEEEFLRRLKGEDNGHKN